MHRVAPVAAIACAGFAAQSLRVYISDSRRANAVLDAEAELARRSREQAIMDMYGDRTSLADLERASAIYASQASADSAKKK